MLNKNIKKITFETELRKLILIGIKDSILDRTTMFPLDSFKKGEAIEIKWKILQSYKSRHSRRTFCTETN